MESILGQGYIDTLEQVQRCAIKCVDDLSHLSNKDSLEELNLYSFYGRQQRGDLTEWLLYSAEPPSFFALNN